MAVDVSVAELPIPVPVRFVDSHCAVPVNTVKVPGAAPIVEGAYRTVIVHDAPAASTPPHVVETRLYGAPMLGEPLTGAVTVTGPALALVNVATCVAEGWPTSTFPKAKADVNVTAGATPVPVQLKALSVGPLAEDAVTEPELAPTTLGDQLTVTVQEVPGNKDAVQPLVREPLVLAIVWLAGRLPVLEIVVLACAVTLVDTLPKS